MTKAAWIPVLILVGTVALSFFAGLGSVPLFDKDEGAFCEATREMVQSGNYVMPYMNGKPRYDKPILIYWLQAASAGVFGMNEGALRLPSALAATFWALATYLFVRRVLDKDRAFLATFLLVTALQVTIIVKAAIADAVLNCFVAISMFCFYRYYTSGLRRDLLYGFAATGLGMLTKGPVAILIPLATTFLFCLLQKDLRRWLRSLVDPIGIGLFLLIVVPWYAVAIWDQGRPILDAWVFKQTLGRLHHPLEGHSGGPLYYFPVLLIGTLPYTALLYSVFRRLRPDFHDPFQQYLLIWFVFVFVFFSFSGTKLPHYIIYGYTPLFILMALHVDRLRRDVWLLLPTAALLACLLAVPFVVPIVAPKVGDEFARTVITDSAHEFNVLFALPIAIGLVVVVALMVVPRVPRMARIIAAGLVVVAVVNLDIMPCVARITQEPVRQAALIARQYGYEVHVWKLNMPSFIFYRQAPVLQDVPQEGDVVLSKTTLARKLAEYDPIYEEHGIVLARVKRILSYTK